ncbi:MAG: hypothetical protein AB8G18_11610 [Gammaproteobacteria bacterium]
MRLILDNSATSFLALALVLVSSPLPASAANNQPWLNISTAYYVDSREFGTAAIGLSSNALPAGFSFWGFSDFLGDQKSNNAHVTHSFSEYRLSHSGLGKWFGVKGLGLQLENDIISGRSNDVIRAGVIYKHDLPLPWLAGRSRQGWLQWRYFPYQDTNTGSQASLIFNLPITDRMGITGFADYNVREGAANRWVAEPELSYRVTNKLFTLIEYRYNQFESANPALDGSAVALGIRYQF